MKKLLLFVVVALVSISASAQKGSKAVGFNLGYGTEVETLSLGVKGLYGITDRIEGEASFNYFLKSNGWTMWNINADAHYLFPLQEKLTVYPIAGLSYVHVGFDYEDEFVEASGSDGKIGLNLGGGIRYNVTNNIDLNAEIKYQIVSVYDQLLLSVGVVYNF